VSDTPGLRLDAKNSTGKAQYKPGLLPAPTVLSRTTVPNYTVAAIPSPAPALFGVSLKPAREQVFEHFYFAIQAALEGLGVIMGPVALIADELRAGRLLAPIRDPVLKTRGYFFYTPEASRDAPALAAVGTWLIAAGSLAEREFPTFLAANRS
jgi:DNA-binding transcriptional LysR family regulator